MKALKILMLSFFIVSCLAGVAGSVTDTLFSLQNDRIIVTYELVEKDDLVEIRFINANKKLSKGHSEIYGYDLSYIKVMIFDREYDFKDIMIKGGLSPKLFMIPEKNLVYSPSDEGYFILDNEQVLRFEGKLSKPTTLSIPFFLAHYKNRLIKKKRPYELFAYCGNLEIKLGQGVAESPSSESPPNQNIVDQPVPPFQGGEEEIEGENPTLLANEGNALAGVQYVLGGLLDKRPNYESLSKEVENLKMLKQKVQNEEIITKIEAALQAYEHHIDSIEKEREKENKRLDSSAFAQCTTIEACSAYLNMYPNGDHVAEVQQKKAELEDEQHRKDKRNKILMIVGVVLLAILMFVGNQVMQSVRDNKMEKKRQDALNKAQEKVQQQQQQLQQQANGETQGKKRYTI